MVKNEKKYFLRESPQFFSPWWEGLPSSIAFCTLGPIWSQNARSPALHGVYHYSWNSSTEGVRPCVLRALAFEYWDAGSLFSGAERVDATRRRCNMSSHSGSGTALILAFGWYGTLHTSELNWCLLEIISADLWRYSGPRSGSAPQIQNHTSHAWRSK